MTTLDRSIKMLEMGDFGYIKNIVTEIKRRNDYTEVKSVIKILKRLTEDDPYYLYLFDFLVGVFPVLTCLVSSYGEKERFPLADWDGRTFRLFRVLGGKSDIQERSKYSKQDLFLDFNNDERIYIYPYGWEDNLFFSHLGKPDLTPTICRGPVAQGAGKMITHTEQEFLSLISENFNLDLENIDDRRKAEIT